MSEQKTQKLQAVKGMNDLLPEDAALWQALERKLYAWFAAYGYRNIRTPVLEQTALFRRGIGEATDIVEKEMFSFTDRLNGDELTMRPEFTAGIVRAVAEHNLLYNGPRRVFSLGPVFRHERPQRGRYRQFHQIDVEALGFAGPDVDAELIIMLARLWRELGLAGMRLEINSLGNLEERHAHRAALVAYFEAHQSELDEDSLRRLHANPLRILDSKNPALQELVNRAPRLTEHLGAESNAHFDQLKQFLDDTPIAYTVNPRMVRGLDYYNLTVFEWITDALGAQGTVCGGGRYDGLIELFGGKPAPAVGFAIGVERLIDAPESVYDAPVGGGASTVSQLTAVRYGRLLRIRYLLDRPARVTVQLLRRVAATKATKAAWLPVLNRPAAAAPAGINRVRLGIGRLPPGVYQVRVRAASTAIRQATNVLVIPAKSPR